MQSLQDQIVRLPSGRRIFQGTKETCILFLIFSKFQMRIDTVANAEEFDKIIDNIDVLSRSRPEDKYAMVVGLIERGNVVAVTGDGN